MVFRILTIFPDFFQGPLQYGVVAKAAESGLIQIHIHDLRDWTHDRHRTVDDRPFGGGEGMLLKPAPIFEAVESIWPERQPNQRLILLSAQGRASIKKPPAASPNTRKSSSSAADTRAWTNAWPSTWPTKSYPSATSSLAAANSARPWSSIASPGCSPAYSGTLTPRSRNPSPPPTSSIARNTRAPPISAAGRSRRY